MSTDTEIPSWDTPSTGGSRPNFLKRDYAATRKAGADNTGVASRRTSARTKIEGRMDTDKIGTH